MFSLHCSPHIALKSTSRNSVGVSCERLSIQSPLPSPHRHPDTLLKKPGRLSCGLSHTVNPAHVALCAVCHIDWEVDLELIYIQTQDFFFFFLLQGHIVSGGTYFCCILRWYLMSVLLSLVLRLVGGFSFGQPDSPHYKVLYQPFTQVILVAIDLCVLFH